LVLQKKVKKGGECMMQFLKEEDRRVIREELSNMVDDVEIVHFTQKFECQFCKETEALLNELAELSPKLHLKVYNFIEDKDKVKEFGIDKIPATIIKDQKKDYGIKYYGIPSGYEFSSLLNDIIMVSTKEVILQDTTKERLSHITSTVHIQVFVTPTCPYCPRAVELAHKMAFINDNILGDMIEVSEFPHLGQRYKVMGVPKTVINNQIEFEGAVPEKVFLNYVIEAAKLTGSSFPPPPKVETPKAEPGKPVILTSDNFDEEVLFSDVPVLVDMWAEWCAPCRAIAPIVEALAKEYQGKLKVGKLNVDENPDIAERYNVYSIPTLLIFKGGNLVEQVIGLQPKHVLEQKIKRFL
jgi:thioredoxin